MSRHGAFTLVELLISTTIIGIVSGAAMIAFGRFSLQITPKREAERALNWLYLTTEKAENAGRSFSIYIKNGSLAVLMNGDGEPETLRSSEGCSFRRQGSGGDSLRSVYSAQWGTFTPAMTIEVSGGAPNSYIILSGQGRMRISDSPPDLEESD